MQKFPLAEFRQQTFLIRGKVCRKNNVSYLPLDNIKTSYINFFLGIMTKEKIYDNF